MRIEVISGYYPKTGGRNLMPRTFLQKGLENIYLHLHFITAGQDFLVKNVL